MMVVKVEPRGRHAGMEGGRYNPVPSPLSRFLILPVSTDHGNSLWRFALPGRPVRPCPCPASPKSAMPYTISSPRPGCKSESDSRGVARDISRICTPFTLFSLQNESEHAVLSFAPNVGDARHRANQVQ
jgi:hypothetical protein